MPALKLSVVIATRNRSLLLKRCLQALRLQTLGPDTFEVIVADDGSEDDTAAMLERLQTPFRLRVLRPGRVGRDAARNAAIQASEAAVCLILDDDVVASPELVAEHVEAHRTTDRMLGIGKITQEPPQARDWYAHAFARAWNRHYEGLLGSRPDWTAGYGANLSAPRAALIDLGGFATSQLPVCEDTDLAFRLVRDGCTPQYLPRAHVVHDDQKRRGRLLDDAHLQGEIHVELARRNPTMMPKLLGWFGAAGAREITLRRVVLGLRVPPAALARLGPLVPGRGRQAIWFDFVARLAFWRGVRRSVTRATWVQVTRGVPILLYHGFGESVEDGRYVMPRRSFARQMRVLSALRYRVVALEDIAETLRAYRLPPRRAVVITIDDGYTDNLQIAQPILARRGLPATIFLVSDRTGERNDWTHDGPLRDRPLLSLVEIARLRAGAIRFGAHSRTHCSLPDVPDDQVKEEVQGSRADLERCLETSIETFAYPYGRYDARAVAAVKSGGFIAACTTESRLMRPDDDPSLIPRIEIRGSDSLPRFLMKLWFGAR